MIFILMVLNEQIKRIRKIIYELSPQSEGITEFLSQVKDFPELLKHLNFDSISSLKEFLEENDYEDFQELKKEVDYFFDRRKRYFVSELDEITRVVQELNREENIEISVADVLDLFARTKETTLSPIIWSKLENTESNKIRKGEINKVKDLAKKYNKQNPIELKKALQSGEYKRPMIIKFGDRYHLVSGNTRLSTAAAIGMKPQVLIAEL